MSISLRKHKRRAAAGMARRFIEYCPARGTARDIHISWFRISRERWNAETASDSLPTPRWRQWVSAGGWRHL